jgi:phospholipid transport system transporter-binding protein
MGGFRIEPAGAGRLAASGELGFNTAAAALEAGLRLIRPGERCTIDLGGITAGDSAGLAVLVEWLSAAQARGAALAYEQVPAQVLAIARISDLDGLLTAQPA